MASGVLEPALGELFCGSIEPVAGATNPTISVNANAKDNNACFIDPFSPILEKMTRFLPLVASNSSRYQRRRIMIPKTKSFGYCGTIRFDRLKAFGMRSKLRG
jgi:hypothetical protein